MSTTCFVHSLIVIIAAIDIGSNAARILINKVNKRNNETSFTKLNLLRIPLKLGFDVFKKGTISKEKTDMFIQTMAIFRDLMKVYEVNHYRACATSAMRDASNGKDVLKKVKKEMGMDIEIISGIEEAEILNENHMSANLVSGEKQLFVDVGGGSTEMTLYVKNEVVEKESFNVGTIRMINGPIPDEEWERFKSFMKSKVKPIKGIQVIGSGGNINKVFSLSKTKEGKAIPAHFLKFIHKELEPISVSKRMKRYNLREDRAAVIVPAMQIYLSALKWGGLDEIFVPKIGLADGIIKKLYYDLSKTS